jgi:hypothetical protein
MYGQTLDDWESMMDGESQQKRDTLDAMLDASDPVDRSRLASAAVGGALDEIGAAIIARERIQHRTARRRFSLRAGRAMVVVGAVIVAGTATLAVAATRSAHTGVLQPTRSNIAHATKAHAQRLRSQVSMGGTGEFLDPSAPDFRDVALQLSSDIPYPQGYQTWRDFLISDEITNADGSTEASGALRGWFAASAFCAWVQVWRQADLSADTATASAAAQMIAQAPTWQAVTALDPNPSASAHGDLGSSSFTLFGWKLPYRDAVVDGNRSTVDGLLAAGYGGKCWADDPNWRAQIASHPDWRALSPDALAQKYDQYLAGEYS